MRQLPLLLLLALLSSCGVMRQSRPAEQRERTILAVENQGFADMSIFVVDGSRRIRVGMAPGHQTTELPLPTSVSYSSGMLRFVADPIGSSRTSVSNEVHISPGSRLLLVIPPS